MLNGENERKQYMWTFHTNNNDSLRPIMAVNKQAVYS